MTSLLICLTLLFLLMPLYVYVGYPLLLWLRVRLGKTKPSQQRDDYLPTVTLVISCYNEVAVIAKKLDNSLSLDYPFDRLKIVVVSDGSEDGSDKVVRSYIGLHTRLVRQEGRLGKTMGLNLAMRQIDSDLVIFSDANSMYAIDAIKKLVRHFVDPAVGYVVGAALYNDGKENAAAANENLYWNYELAIKQWESQLHSVVGGDGAIYAIRRELWEPLQQRDINDFVNPLQIVAKGFRGLFDSEARCYEETAGNFAKEAGRKERIVNRSLRGLMRVKEVMNPFKTGWFSLQVISHKLLRWLIPFFALFALVGSVVLAAQAFLFFQLITLGSLLLAIVAFVGYLLQSRPRLPWLISFPYYFVTVNVYAMRGIISALAGKTQITWSSARPGDVTGKASGPVRLGGILTFMVIIAVLIAGLSRPYV